MTSDTTAVSVNRPELALCLLDTLEQPTAKTSGRYWGGVDCRQHSAAVGAVDAGEHRGHPPGATAIARRDRQIHSAVLPQGTDPDGAQQGQGGARGPSGGPAAPAGHAGSPACLPRRPPVIAHNVPQPAAAPIVEPPSIRVGQSPVPSLGTPNVPAPPVPAPQIQAQEKPKLAFETPGSPSASPGPIAGQYSGSTPACYRRRRYTPVCQVRGRRSSRRG